MGGIYVRGRKLWRWFIDVDGRRVFQPTGCLVGEEDRARKVLDTIERRVQAERSTGLSAAGSGPVTVARYAPRWLEQRKAHVQTWRNDDAVMRLHVLPTLGSLRLDEVRPKHLVDLVRSWRARTADDAMAPKSVWNGYSTLSAFFRDAALEDLIAQTPCVLTKHQLGPKVDKNPEWRHTAKFGRAELELLISDERVPLDRRVFYALEGVGGFRLGEASGLLWRNTLVPVPEHSDSLDMLLVAYSYERPFPKGNVTRPVPAHPTLAAMLAEWKLTGWRRLMGREPTPDDLVLPLPPDAVSKAGRWRRKAWVRKHFTRDLETLAMRHRRGHDLRRTCISLARSDGAQKEIHKRTTHKPPTEVIEGYTSFEWDVLCREVIKLQVKRHHTGKVIALPLAKASGAESVTPVLQPVASLGRRGRKSVALPGLEHESGTHDNLREPATIEEQREVPRRTDEPRRLSADDAVTDRVTVPVDLLRELADLARSVDAQQLLAKLERYLAGGGL